MAEPLTKTPTFDDVKFRRVGSAVGGFRIGVQICNLYSGLTAGFQTEQLGQENNKDFGGKVSIPPITASRTM